MEARQRACLRSLTPVLFLASVICGCSKQDWLSKIYLFRAEEAYTKAYVLRLEKAASYEERLRYYRKACEFFLKAYDHSHRAFTLSRIDSAAESCMRVGNYEAEEKFREFEERYIQAHPKEVKYGDAVPFMSLE